MTRFIAGVSIVVLVIVTALWMVIGFFLWVPLLVRMIAIFTAAVVSSMYSGISPIPARDGLIFAMAFYSDGFILIWSTFKGEPKERTFSKVSRPDNLSRVLLELSLAAAFWVAVIFAVVLVRHAL